MKEIKIFKIAFNKCSEFLKNISENNLETLENDFDISPAIFEEIMEAIKPYNKQTENNIFRIKELEFEVFKYNNVDFGIEATLFTNQNKKTELTLHADLINQELAKYKFQYKLIEVM